MSYLVPTGVRSQTVNNMVIDAARLYYAQDISPLGDPAAVDPLATVLSTAKLSGVSRGGATFSTEFEYRQPEFDGSRGDYPIKQLMRAAPMIAGNFVEIDRRNMTKIVPAMRAKMLPNGFTKYEFFKELVEEDYLNNLVCIARHGNRNLPVVIAMPKVLNESTFSLETTDAGEPVIAAEFKGIYDLLNDSVVPVELYMANEAGVILTLADDAPTVTTAAGTVDLIANLIWVDGYDSDITISLENDPHKPLSNFLPSSVGISAGDTITGSGQAATHTITLDTTGLAAGTYNGYIRFTDNDSILDYTPFTLTVTA